MTSTPKSLALTLLLAFTTPVLAEAPTPNNARFTIILQNFDRPGHYRLAKQQKEYFEKTTGLHDFYVVHTEAQSTLYYGFYQTVETRENKDEARRAQTDLARFTNFEVDGQKPFQGAIFIGLPTPNPEAPPEWDICNATGTYSIEIAAYRGVGDRKQNAVDCVREARKMGIEAYYYHGPNTSSVLIGSFPDTSVVQNNDKPQAEPGKNLLVLPNKPSNVPDEVPSDDGGRTKVFAAEIKIIDPVMMDIIRRYPHHAVNGNENKRIYTDPKTGKIIEVYDDSLIIDIRQIRRESILGAGPVNPNNSNAPDHTIIAPRPSTPGEGKLKGFK